METINNMANAAAKAVWGEGQAAREPISGAQGDVTRGEPYDAGNLETPYQERLENNFGNNNTSTGSRPTDKTTESTNLDKILKSTHLGNTTESTNLDKIPESTNSGKTTESTNLDKIPEISFGKTTESTNLDKIPESTNSGKTTESTNLDKVPENISFGKTTESASFANTAESAPKTTAHTENAAYASTDSPAEQNQQEDGLLNQADLKGTGPRPLEVVAKEHGGDANPNHSRSENTLGASVGGENQTDTANQGTGKEYVKASGLAADGGDFDATKPGAGREADRLLEEKGVHRDDAAGPGNHSESSHGNQKDKPSLGERIKAKFHKH